MYIYLDMNVYNRMFDDQQQLKIRFETMAIDIIFDFIENNYYNLCWSFMLEYENDKNPFTNRKMYIKLLSKFCNTVIVPEQEIKDMAEKIIALSNAKIKDALHLACAVHKKCNYFITCDDRFIRTIEKNKELLKDYLAVTTLFNPIDFVRKELKIDVIE